MTTSQTYSGYLYVPNIHKASNTNGYTIKVDGTDEKFWPLLVEFELLEQIRTTLEPMITDLKLVGVWVRFQVISSERATTIALISINEPVTLPPRAKGVKGIASFDDTYVFTAVYEYGNYIGKLSHNLYPINWKTMALSKDATFVEVKALTIEEFINENM